MDEDKELSVTQKERIKNNRLKALQLRKSRIRHNPYQRKDLCSEPGTSGTNIFEDSKGGFILPDNDRDNHLIQPIITKDDRKLVCS